MYPAWQHWPKKEIATAILMKSKMSLIIKCILLTFIIQMFLMASGAQLGGFSRNDPFWKQCLSLFYFFNLIFSTIHFLVTVIQYFSSFQKTNIQRTVFCFLGGGGGGLGIVQFLANIVICADGNKMLNEYLNNFSKINALLYDI